MTAPAGTFTLLLTGGPLDGEEVYLPVDARGLAIGLGKLILPAWGPVPDGVEPSPQNVPVRRVVYTFSDIFLRGAEVVTAWTYEKVFEWA
jgi:hypothetical protein